MLQTKDLGNGMVAVTDPRFTPEGERKGDRVSWGAVFGVIGAFLVVIVLLLLAKSFGGER